MLALYLMVGAAQLVGGSEASSLRSDPWVEGRSLPYKQTNRQTDKPNLYIDTRNSGRFAPFFQAFRERLYFISFVKIKYTGLLLVNK